jgi:GT2 family glycosyltransferase
MATAKKEIILSVIVVSYNTKDLTIQSLDTAIDEINSSKILKDKTEIFLVDNDSKDGSAKACQDFLKKKKFPYFKVFANKDNLGFAKANNQATKVSKGKYIILLNSDVIVLKGGLSKLVETFEKNPIEEKTASLERSNEKLDRLGILVPTLLNKDKTIQNQGGSLPSLATIASQMLFLDDLPLFGKLFPSTQDTGRSAAALKDHHTENKKLIQKGWVGGTAMMFRRELIDEIGMLDGNIFMYGEDQEFCMRAKNHHWDIAIHPQAKIVHFGSASSSSRNAILGEFKGYLYIFKKHKNKFQLSVLKIILWLGASLREIIYSLTKQEVPAKIYKDAKELLK